MSITTVRGSADGAGLSGSPCVPDFITRPGWYITALWPEMRLSPVSIQLSATTSSRRVCRSGPALSTVPSGSTNERVHRVAERRAGERSPHIEGGIVDFRRVSQLPGNGPAADGEDPPVGERGRRRIPARKRHVRDPGPAPVVASNRLVSTMPV